MKTDSFLTEDFLLQSDFARRLYHGYAKAQPIIDYHCHLPPDEIASDKKFENMTTIWLAGDHYKWRAMRTVGIDEKYITGKASDREKFDKWAFVLPRTMRNPLFHWSVLELKRYFDIDTLLTTETADEVYSACNELLATPQFSSRQLIRRMNVQVIGTTDDPIDTLEHHKAIRNDKFETKVLPSFRPDNAIAIENPETYKAYINKLSEVSGVTINSFDTLLEALRNRIDYFHETGCRISDHGLERMYYSPASADLNRIFKNVIDQKAPTPEEIEVFKFRALVELGKMYHTKGWVQQFHLGAIRSNSSRKLRELGPNTGFDSIGDFPQGVTLSKYLDTLDSTDQLARTILYNLNPADNELLATMAANFNDGTVKGKMQFGSGWWFNDQKDGMEKQLNALSNLGLISCFIGMLTDSRSFLSYPRHEYFRRILCNLIGRDVANGELPADEKWLGQLVADVCYHNAKSYFGF